MMMIKKCFIVSLMILFLAPIIDACLQISVLRYIFPEQFALEEFEFSDFYFAEKNDSILSKDVTIVNIGNVSRREIAELINNISESKPKVIGINAYFDCEGGLTDSINCPQLLDTIGNINLSNAIKKAKNVVLISKLLQTTASLDSDKYDSIEFSDKPFSGYARNGFANLPVAIKESKYNFNICRSFYPSFKVNGVTQYYFAIEMAKAYDSIATSKFLARGNEEEIISFSGNINYDMGFPIKEFKGIYKTYDVAEVLEKRFDPALIKDRIVIIGYLGDKISLFLDDFGFYTPLNKKPLGRSVPDMYGTTINANIISMILKDQVINVLPNLVELLIAFAICMIHVFFLIRINQYFEKWNEVLSATLIVLMLGLFAFLRIELFNYSIKASFALTLTSLAISGITLSIYNNLYRWWSKIPERPISPLFDYVFYSIVIMLFSVSFTMENPVRFFGFCYFMLLILSLILYGLSKWRKLNGEKTFLTFLIVVLLSGSPLVSILESLN
ncbi:MAG: CHASE2 domain-containing protein [Cyclobacteriaceae bacterium]